MSDEDPQIAVREECKAGACASAWAQYYEVRPAAARAPPPPALP